MAGVPIQLEVHTVVVFGKVLCRVGVSIPSMLSWWWVKGIRFVSERTRGVEIPF